MKQDRFGLDSDVPAGTFSNTKMRERGAAEIEARAPAVPVRPTQNRVESGDPLPDPERSEVDTLVGFTAVLPGKLDVAWAEQEPQPAPPPDDPFEVSGAEGEGMPEPPTLPLPDDPAERMADVRAAVAGAELTLELLDAPFVGIEAEPDLEGFHIQREAPQPTFPAPPPHPLPAAASVTDGYAGEETSQVHRVAPVTASAGRAVEELQELSVAELEEFDETGDRISRRPLRGDESSQPRPHPPEPPTEVEETIRDLLKLQESYGAPQAPAFDADGLIDEELPPAPEPPAPWFPPSRSSPVFSTDGNAALTRVSRPRRSSAGPAAGPGDEARDLAGLLPRVDEDGASSSRWIGRSRSVPPPLPGAGRRRRGGEPPGGSRGSDGEAVSSLSPAERSPASSARPSRRASRWTAGALLVAAMILLGAFGWGVVQPGGLLGGQPQARTGEAPASAAAASADSPASSPPPQPQPAADGPSSGAALPAPEPDPPAPAEPSDEASGLRPAAPPVVASGNRPDTVDVADVAAAAPVDDTAFQEPDVPPAPEVPLRSSAAQGPRARSLDGVDGAGEAPAPEEPADGAGLPQLPARKDVQAAMAAVRPRVRACAAGRKGVATVIVTAISTGRVTHALVTGPLSGSAEGSCLARAVRSARLPAFNQVTFQFAYDFNL